MKALVLAVATLLSSSVAIAKNTTPVDRAETGLRAALHDQAAARASWDAAVAAGHPSLAGQWARRHFAAMQEVKAATSRAQAARRAANHTVATR